MSGKNWQIGELAKRAGVSVRTLRHYDAIGLLSPRETTQAGYRLYDEKALMQLETRCGAWSSPSCPLRTPMTRW